MDYFGKNPFVIVKMTSESVNISFSSVKSRKERKGNRFSGKRKGSRKNSFLEKTIFIHVIKKLILYHI